MSGLNLKDAKQFLYDIQKQKDKAKRDPEDMNIDGNLLEDRKNVLNLKIVAILDVSGSISMSVFMKFMHCLENIKGLSQIKVIEVDTEIVAMYTYCKKAQGNRVIRLAGGGGTALKPGFILAQKMLADAVICFTDGFVSDSFGSPGIPVGFILTSDGKKPYNFGEVILKLSSKDEEEE